MPQTWPRSSPVGLFGRSVPHTLSLFSSSWVNRVQETSCLEPSTSLPLHPQHVTVSSLRATSNVAAGCGGAVEVSPGAAPLVLANSTFSNNVAGLCGGALALEFEPSSSSSSGSSSVGPTVSLASNSFSNNRAPFGATVYTAGFLSPNVTALAAALQSLCGPTPNSVANSSGACPAGLDRVAALVSQPAFDAAAVLSVASTSQILSPPSSVFLDINFGPLLSAMSGADLENLRAFLGGPLAAQTSPLSIAYSPPADGAPLLAGEK